MSGTNAIPARHRLAKLTDATDSFDVVAVRRV
jgi:hypothetical protein